ncbi:zinc-binding alcohol dehydrogenase [Rhizobium sp. P44RR-XXIV]|uniref:zinc-dependent alcohol dehydrogenase n=1 Tax=Rhizobium sp. P44RR-XXIV TaxID=1921145 RepID=UPI0009864FF7|nr:zinc-binding alcohol dehydrogenase [Rhizobium sp. P44RR-XXIV]TIX90736.1 zinc-binding alcohol dehydrogenase [Rhizobium sp. P44RR-XXIV]
MTKGIVFSGKNQVEIETAELPALGPEEVSGRTIVTLVSPGTELAWLAGDAFPLRPGYAAIFRAEELGASVIDIDVGDLLFCMGPHRSVQQVDFRHTLKLPSGLPAEVAVLARLAGVSMTTLMTTKARPGDVVVVTGAGPVGYLAAQLFRLSGYDVCVVDPDPIRRRQIESAGVRRAYSTMPFDDIAVAGKAALVVDCSGHEGAVLDGCRIVRPHGEVVLVGVPWRRMTDIHAHDVLHTVFNNFVHLRSGWEWEVPILAKAFRWEELLEGYNNVDQSVFSGFAKILSWLADGRIHTSGLIRRISPENPTAAYEALRLRSFEEPFIVFDWNSGTTT